MTTTTRTHTRIGVGAVALVAGLTLTACSGSSSHATSTPTGAAPSSASTTSAANPLAATVKDAVDKLTQRPTHLDVGPKISKPIPTGKKIATIDCSADACKIIDGLTKDAAKSLGWTTEEIATDGSAQQIGNAWKRAIQEHVDGIVQAGVSRPQVETYIQQAKKAGIAVVLVASTDAPGNGVLSVVQDGDSSVPQGVNMANWTANDAYQSGDPNASILYVDIPDFKVLSFIKKGWDETIKASCPGCKVEALDVGLSSLQQAKDLITSKLRSNPSIKYVVFSVQNIFDAVPPALKAAGINVKTVGATPGDVSLNQLRSGQITAVEAFPAYEEAYASIDVFARHFAGVLDTEPPATYTIPQWMMTKDNAPKENVFPIVADLVSQYAAVWGK